MGLKFDVHLTDVSLMYHIFTNQIFACFCVHVRVCVFGGGGADARACAHIREDDLYFTWLLAEA
jgi:hypothetical protein